MRRSLRFAFPLIVGLGLMAGVATASAVTAGTAPLVKPIAPAEVIKADWYCGRGWSLYRGACVPYGFGYGYWGPGISFWWGPRYHYHYHHYHHYNYRHPRYYHHYRYHRRYRHYRYHGHHGHYAHHHYAHHAHAHHGGHHGHHGGHHGHRGRH